MIGVKPSPIPKGPGMNPDLDSLPAILYETVDDLLIRYPERAPERPAVGIAPRLSGRRVGHPWR